MLTFKRGAFGAFGTVVPWAPQDVTLATVLGAVGDAGAVFDVVCG